MRVEQLDQSTRLYEQDHSQQVQEMSEEIGKLRGIANELSQQKKQLLM